MSARSHFHRCCSQLAVLILLPFLMVGELQAKEEAAETEVTDQSSNGRPLAYVILDSERLPATSPQPKLIALKGLRGGRFLHVKTGQTIIAVPPGRYRVEHIDFQSRVSGLGTIDMDHASGEIRFDAQEDSIAYVGMIRIKGQVRVGQTVMDVALTEPVQLFEWACAAQPDLLNRLPVRIAIHRDPPVITRIRCQQD